MRANDETRVTVEVPVRFANESASPGIKRGGVLNVVRHMIEVRCRAAAIPPHFTVDLTGLEIGGSVHSSRLTLPEGVTLTITRDFTIATIAAPTVVAEEAAAAAAAAIAAAAAAEAAAALGEAGATPRAAPGAAPRAGGQPAKKE
jgi:large subunit ribosomal protein L25